MELCFIQFIYLIVILTTNQTLASVTKPGCAKSAFHSRSSLSRPKSIVHILPNELLKGLKRSIKDNDSDDCIEKKSETPIQQKSVGTIAKSNNLFLAHFIKSKNSTEKRSKTSSQALSHIVKTENAVKRGILKKTPNLKTLQNSPLWSLSKLIDDVSDITEKKSHKNKTTASINIKDETTSVFPLLPGYLSKHKTGITKGTIDSNDNSLKRKLVKAIEKVENVAEHKQTAISGPAEKLLEVVKRINKTVEGVRKSVENKTITSAVKSNATNANSVKVTSKAPIDPYAEIAAGPDRPKLPELKGGGDETAGVSDGPIMKFGQGGEQVAAMGKDSKPLSGQHDVGGLLDSLTDKLNAGGGIANDQPLSGNEVKYMQSQVGSEEGSEKLQPSDQQLPTSGVAASPEGATPEQALESDPASALSHQMPSTMGSMKEEAQINNRLEEEGATSKMETAQAEDGGLDKEIMDKLSATEEGLSKTINEKANSLSRFGTMDILKGAKVGGDEATDYSDADISAGPDPYAFPSDSGRDRAANVPVGTPFGSNEMETSDLMNSGGLSNIGEQDGMERSGGTTQGDAGAYEQGEENPGAYEQGRNMPGDTRSRTKSYLNEAMGAMNDESSYNTRQNIPSALWNAVRGIENADPYRNSYNTQMFKKNTILRPEVDNYVSPFTGKESFENDA